MKSIFVSCILLGDDFSPTELENISDLRLSSKLEKGGMGKSGKIRKTGVKDIYLTLNLEYEEQCNWEFKNKQLKQIIDMDIDFSVTCFKST